MNLGHTSNKTVEMSDCFGRRGPKKTLDYDFIGVTQQFWKYSHAQNSKTVNK